MKISKTPPMLDDPLTYNYRRRGVNIPTEQALQKYRKAEHKRRARLLGNVTVTLHHYWYEFASEQFSDIPKQDDLGRAYMLFLNCYAQFLWQFKNNRKSKDYINKYWHGIRVVMWDENMKIWKEISKCYDAITSDNFYDELTRLSVRVGYAAKEMKMFAKGTLNASEHVIHNELSRRKGAEKRHAENHAMKRDVFNWLDANPPKPRGLDAAATEIFESKIVPIKSWRTARDWVGEWKKLRSAGSP